MALQKPTRGLPDLLGLFESGAVPLEFAGVVQPALDILPFLEPPRWATEQKTIDTLGEFDVIGPPVPDNEFWYVRFLGIASSSVIPSGRTVLEVPRLAINNGSTQVGLDNSHVGNLTFGTTSAGVHINQGIFFPQFLIMNPGDQIGWFTSYISGSAMSLACTMGVQYHKVRF